MQPVSHGIMHRFQPFFIGARVYVIHKNFTFPYLKTKKEIYFLFGFIIHFKVYIVKCNF